MQFTWEGHQLKAAIANGQNSNRRIKAILKGLPTAIHGNKPFRLFN